MEYKYIKIPVLSKQQHEEIVDQCGFGEGLAELKKHLGDEADTYWTAWFFDGRVWSLNSGGTAVERNTSFGSAIEAGVNGLVDAPAAPEKPQSNTERYEKQAEREFMLEMMALARSDDAAVALIRQKKEV